MNPNKNPHFSPQKFICELCDYTTANKKDFRKHSETIKHLNRGNPNKSDIEKSPQIEKIFECACGKIYKHYSTLCNHKKKCTFETPSVIVSETGSTNSVSVSSSDLIQLFITQSKENQELKNLLIDQNKLFMELCTKNNNGNNNTIHNNSHNKTFNLQFFLNEQCKDAMNIMDFVNSVTLQLSDLESVGQLGYVEGITKIMIKKLTDMDIYKRPVHCSDAKREIIHVKDNDVWAKEEETYPKLRRAIKYITKKNSDLLLVWSAKYPESKNIYSKVNETYLIMLHQAMGGTGEVTENENKIIKKISKMILIDK
jgi:hypothetical protein